MSKDDDESYPPPFRQAARQINLNIVERISSADPDDPIPTIDLEALSLESLADACENWGVFRLVNHGVPAALFSHLHHTSKHLFSLPFHTKQTLFGGTSSYFWGTPALSPSGTALPSKLLLNWVEGFYAALSQHDPLLPSHHHPPILNTFRNLVEEYGKHMGRIARALGESMGKNLKMNSSDKQASTSEVVLSEETSILRVYRYPIMTTCNENTWGMDAHTDSSVISIILCQDDVASLEFLNSNKWHLVKPVPNSLVIQLGDMMQAMSDDRYTSVRHRVRVNRYKERVSFGYFVFPQDDHVIFSSKYKPFSYSDFRAQVQQDLQTIGRKVGLERFRLKGP